MRVGIFGGTFDPVHMGHLILAEQCREQATLDQVRFVPAPRPPHKRDDDLTPYPHRVAMLRLALAGQPGFLVDELEKDRFGPSYTADTLDELHHLFPEAQLSLLLGSDCLPDLVHWRDPARIALLADLLIVSRPGWSVDLLDEVRQSLDLRDLQKLRVIHSPEIGIASRDLRARAASGRSLRYQVPPAVECYIINHHLYPGANAPGTES